jgi:hypothetical protein
VATRAGHCTLKVNGYNLRRYAPAVGYVLSCGDAYRVYPCLRLVIRGAVGDIGVLINATKG